MRILVVEDDRKVASFIRKGLEEEGHAVEVAGDGAAAIERAMDGAPLDRVVLDVMLPKGDVWSAALKRPIALKKKPNPWMSGDRQPRPLARLVTLRDFEAASL